SSAAATISPSTTRAAAGSWKTALTPRTVGMAGAYRSAIRPIPGAEAPATPAGRAGAATSAAVGAGPPVGRRVVAARGGLEDPGRRPAGDQRDEHHVAAPPGERVPLGDLLPGVVGALDEHVGTQQLQELARGVLVEHRDPVDAGQPGEHGPTVLDRVDGAVPPLEAPHRQVAVQADDEAVAERAGGLQHAHVPGVQDVEAPRSEERRVGEESWVGY